MSIGQAVHALVKQIAASARNKAGLRAHTIDAAACVPASSGPRLFPLMTSEVVDLKIDTRLLQRRSYDDTFGGGDYLLDMAENLGAVSPLPMADPVLEDGAPRELYQTQRLKQLLAYYTQERPASPETGLNG